MMTADGMKVSVMRRWVVSLWLTIALCAPALADPVEDFYRGRNVTLLIGYTVAGGYDTYARVLAHYLGRHIPGNPTMCRKTWPAPGACGPPTFCTTPRPRTAPVIGTFSRGMAMEPLIGASSTQFDSRKFSWLGSGTDEVSTCVTWRDTPVRAGPTR